MSALVVVTLVSTGYSQNVNWRSLRADQQNVMHFSFGYDFGAAAQVGYSRSFTLIRPVVVGLDYSSPMGRDLVDDFKVRVGAQIEIVQVGGFSTTLKIASNFRRYENALVRIAGFGADCAVLAGYYRSTWYAAGEFGFDKSIVSHLRHSDVMKANFPAIRDGWYIPTGGNFYYGIQGSKTIGESLDLSLRLGATSAQNRDEDALVPWYGQLGLDIKF
ncbi:MAG: hypothetical protein IT282_05085 [Bacteroidetes bacterium]|nr:hypothetical protein [Bacteroidota bacterium]